MSGDFIGLLIGLILTLFIYSYVVGDNPLYRLSVHLLVGVSAAYSAVIVIRHIILPVANQIIQNPTERESLLWAIPLFFVLLLLLKRAPGLAWLSNNSVALLVGVGAAVALLGALTGTLWPQITAVAASDPGYQTIIIAILTVLTLLSFQFTGRFKKDGQWQRPVWQRGIVHIGRATLIITFGVLFVALLNTSLILLSSRLGYFLTQLQQQLP